MHRLCSLIFISPNHVDIAAKMNGILSAQMNEQQLMLDKAENEFLVTFLVVISYETNFFVFFSLSLSQSVRCASALVTPQFRC